ncbi:MAG: RNA-binding transcriptional accessory protein [Kiritimatiellaeota bacterium]|nr:RNA-binding transcriptional accessory protein [Kiritimatiellota bacterium]
MTTEIDTPDAPGSIELLVDELKLSPRQIAAVARLLAEGNTIPFIARYRKEVHGNLDEVQLTKIQERLTYYHELEERRETILRSIEAQGKMTDELRVKIMACRSKTVLEDLYLPYKPKRRTRAMIARERGLEPLAEKLLAQGSEDPAEAAAAFINAEKEVPDAATALAGARDIVAEQISESADVRSLVRGAMSSHGTLVSEVVEPKPTEPTKFEQYYDFQERVSAIPGHRYLAIKRGQAEGVLRVRLNVEPAPLLDRVAEMHHLNPASPWAPALRQSVEDAYKRLILPSVEIDVMVELKMKADTTAVDVFAQNLRNLLLQSPLGGRVVLGIDPGFRTGCKCVVIDATGKFLETTTLYPTQGDRAALEAAVDLSKLITKHTPFAIAIGNGTAGRETEDFVRKLLKHRGWDNILVILVNESGASVYSASDVAREEFPDLDLTIRGAISIGRRLQDPLAELVKIDPKSIGVGQYQHDVTPTLLTRKLDDVVVSCVNHVGVELNTASAPLLSRVAGLNASLAKKIVSHRDANGPFASRKALLTVQGLGPKTFEQAAGFLRIRGAEHPLDASAVHPERYPLVEKMASDAGVTLAALVGDAALVDKIPTSKYVSVDAGEATLKDILAELKKPGRDPRAVFEAPAFREDVREISDVTPGMKLEGVVTNVTAFGAFVDIGVHQDGLIHVSELSDKFIRDPAEAVKTGDRLKVTVLTVDTARKRISLSAKSNPNAPKPPNRDPRGKPPPPPRREFNNNPFANL